MADKEQTGGGILGLFRRKLKLNKGGLLGSVSRRQAALDEVMAPIPKKKKKKKKLDTEG